MQTPTLDRKNDPIFSIYWEIRVLLYLGVLLLASGSGILIYKNIDSIGHQAILAAIALMAAGCLAYSAKKAAPFTWDQAASSSLADYALLLGSLLFGVFVGYLQFQYEIFGSRHALLVGGPAMVYFHLAYRYDHRGVLQLGISGISAAAGLAATPVDMLRAMVDWESRSIWIGLILGSFFCVVAFLSEKRKWKSHFAFSFYHFALHFCLLAAFHGTFRGGFGSKTFFLLLLLSFSLAFGALARSRQSPYFLLCAVVYAYAGVTSWLITAVLSASDWGEGAIYFLFLYFLSSCAGTVLFFLNMKKILGIRNAGLSQN